MTAVSAMLQRRRRRRAVAVLLAAGAARASAATSCWRRCPRRRMACGRHADRRRSVRCTWSRRCRASIAVVRPRRRALAARLRRDRRAIVRYAIARSDGMGASLACGVAAQPRDARRLGRRARPTCRGSPPPRSRAVADALRDGAAIVAPLHDGERGHPVGFARATIASLAALSGDEGARSVRRGATSASCEMVARRRSGVLRDVDQPETRRSRVPDCRCRAPRRAQARRRGRPAARLAAPPWTHRAPEIGLAQVLRLRVLARRHHARKLRLERTR